MLFVENIQKYRRAYDLTQKDLARVLGVSESAVYKWESGKNEPDLRTVIRMADYFRISVDALLGCEMNSDSAGDCAVSLKDAYINGNREILPDMELILIRYPYSFDIVYGCAKLYQLFGSEDHNNDMLRRALELFNRAVPLVTHHAELQIEELSLYNDIAETHALLGETELALAMWKKYNRNNSFNMLIGLTLAEKTDRNEEALSYFSRSMLKSIYDVANTVYGYAKVYVSQQNYREAEHILLIGLSFISNFQAEDTGSFLDKIVGILFILLADVQLRLRDTAAAVRSLEKARDLMARYEAFPSYTAGTVPFIHLEHINMPYDLASLINSDMDKFVSSLKNSELNTLWFGGPR